MSVNVYWTNNAVRQLDAIYEYIGQTSFDYALRMVDKITRRSEQIVVFPMSGRIVPEFSDPNIRELIERPYRIIYRVTEDGVDVLAVVHGARNLDENLLENDSSR
jgi:toxin ParE1/3/4